MLRKESGEVTLAKMSEHCEAMRQQALALDEIDINVNYVNVPTIMKTVEDKAIIVIKTLMWPFLKIDPEHIMYSTWSIPPTVRPGPLSARLQFHRETPSFDLIITRPQEKIQFGQIRLPYPLEMVLPLKGAVGMVLPLKGAVGAVAVEGAVNNLKMVAQKFTGHTLFPVCNVEGHTLNTFDNR